MFTVKNIDFEFDTFDADNAGRYEEALKKVEKTAEVMKQDISLKNKIIKSCKIIYEAIDYIFGIGTSEKMFGKNVYNIREASATWHEIVEHISKQSSEEAELFISTINNK